MTTELHDKIIRLSKDLKFDTSRNFIRNGSTTIVYEASIVKNPKYPENLFLLHKNMIMNAGTIDDTAFDVHKFDKGGYVGRMDITKIGRDFFRELEKIRDIK